MNSDIIDSISVITLGVADAEAAVRFYEHALGLRRSQRPSDVHYFDLGAIKLAVFDRDALAEYAGVAKSAPTGFTGVTVSSNVPSRARVDAVFARAVAAGARAVRAPGDTAWGGYAAWIADPDGHLWEIVWNPRWPAPPD